MHGDIDIRSNPVVREQVMAIVRRTAAPPPVPTAVASLGPTVSQRLEQLQALHAAGAITDAEYNAKRQEILADL